MITVSGMAQSAYLASSLAASRSGAGGPTVPGVDSTRSVSPLRPALGGAVDQAVARLDRQQSAFEVRLSGLGRLQGALAELGQGVASIAAVADAGPVAAVSADPGVLAARATAAAPASGQYGVDVRQLAAGAELQSASFAGAAAQVGSGQLVLRTGSNNSDGSFTATGPATTIEVSSVGGSLSGIAELINRANAGVSASVVGDDSGRARLSLTGPAGAASGFSVEVFDQGGNALVGGAGLGRLAYDPGAPQQEGGLTRTRSGQDALLQVTGPAGGAAGTRVVSSASNEVNGAIPGVSLNLSGVGVTSVALGAEDSSAGFMEALQGFAGALNAYRDARDGLAAGALAGSMGGGDRLLADIDAALGRALGRAGETGQDGQRFSLASLGFEQSADGRVAFTSAEAERAFGRDPVAAMATLSEAARGLGAVVQGIAGGELERAGAMASRDLADVQQRSSLLSAFAGGLGNGARDSGAMTGLPQVSPFSLFSPGLPGPGSAAGAALRYQQVASLSGF